MISNKRRQMSNTYSWKEKTHRRKYSKTFSSGYLRMISGDFSSSHSSGGCTASCDNYILIFLSPRYKSIPPSPLLFPSLFQGCGNLKTKLAGYINLLFFTIFSRMILI